MQPACQPQSRWGNLFNSQCYSLGLDSFDRGCVCLLHDTGTRWQSRVVSSVATRPPDLTASKLLDKSRFRVQESDRLASPRIVLPRPIWHESPISLKINVRQVRYSDILLHTYISTTYSVPMHNLYPSKPTWFSIRSTSWY